MPASFTPKNYCFACGPDNPEGLRLVFRYTPKKHLVVCTVKIPARYQGATGFAHGGILATLLDEAMAKSNGLSGIRAMTLRLHVSYRRVASIERKLRLTGWRIRKRGRKLNLRSELRDPAGNLLAEARGLFLEVAVPPKGIPSPSIAGASKRPTQSRSRKRPKASKGTSLPRRS